MATVHEIEVWVMVNESGEWEVGTSVDEVGERFSANCSTNESSRVVCLKLKVPAPVVLTLTGEVPEELNGTIALTAE